MGIKKEGKQNITTTAAPCKKHQKKSTTKVRFGRNTCRWFAKDLTKEEMSKIWYKKEDYYRIHCNNQAQIRGALGINRKGYPKHFAVPYDEETMNVRGLEHHFPGNVNEKKHRRRQHAHYVLHAQSPNVTNTHELLEYVAYMSDCGQRRAQRIAGYDAFEAFRVHREANKHFHNKEYAEFSCAPKPASLRAQTPRQRSITAQLA